MPNILIGTPIHDHRVHIGYLNSILGMLTNTPPDYNIAIFTVLGNSIIQAARNTILTKFIEDKQFDYLLFLDSDIQVPDYTLTKLVNRNKDIIGLPVPLKLIRPDGVTPYSLGEVYDVEDNLAVVSGIPTACMLISRRVANAIEKEYHDKIYYPEEAATNFKGKVYNVFRVIVENGTFYGEDYAFCKDMQNLGFKIYADLTIPITHYGVVGFEGNFQHLIKEFHAKLNKKDN